MTEATEARTDEASSARPAATAAIREKILSSDDLKRQPINLEKWWPETAGAKLFVRSMSAGDRSRYEQSMDFGPDGKPRDRDNLAGKLVVRVLVDAEGNRVFADDDLELLALKNSAAIQHIFNVGADLNGLTKEAQQELEKNSGKTPTDM